MPGKNCLPFDNCTTTKLRTHQYFVTVVTFEFQLESRHIRKALSLNSEISRIAGGENASAVIETKEQVLQYIKEHPGAHLRQIKRDLGVSMGVIQYHLYTLEREKKILSRRSGLYKRFFPALVFGEHQQEILDVLSQETERDLLLYLIQNPGSTQKDLSMYAQISPGTINWHMKRMIASDLIRVKHEGQFVKYEVNAETTEILKLVQSYHPSLWQSWVDRFTDAINEVSPLPAAERETRYTSEEQHVAENQKENKKSDI